MIDRGKQLYATAGAQITDLIDLLSTLGEGTLRLPCPGREKLGDGTVAASARHTADNYQRIATFVQTSDRMSGSREPAEPGAHPVPRLSRALGRGPADGTAHDPAPARHDDEYTADTVDLGAVIAGLSASHDALEQIAELSNSQLDAIPSNGSFRFCDGQRTLEQVITSLLKHQRHQVDALTAALA